MSADRAEQEKSAVLFLGMHRSGTSAVAGVFSRLGVELGSELLRPAADNPKGFYEHERIVALHDEVLATLDSSWDDPRPLPQGWARDPRLIPLRDRLRAILLAEFSGKPLWGFKDPRLCRLLPLWLPLLHDLLVRPKFVLVVRNPWDAARSLRLRDGILQEQSSMLWLSHIVSAEQNTRDRPRTVLFYDDLLSDWRAETARIQRELGLDLCALSGAVVREIEEFLSADLRHQTDSSRVAVYAPPNLHVEAAYEALCAWRRGEVPRDDVFDGAERALAAAEASARPVADYLLNRANSEIQQANALRDHARKDLARLEADAELARAVAQEAQAEADRIRTECEAARLDAAAARREADAASIEANGARMDADAARKRAEAARAEAEAALRAKADAEGAAQAERNDIARLAAMRRTERDEVVQLMAAKNAEIGRLETSLANFSAFNHWVRKNPLFALIWLTNRLWAGQFHGMTHALRVRLRRRSDRLRVGWRLGWVRPRLRPGAMLLRESPAATADGATLCSLEPPGGGVGAETANRRPIGRAGHYAGYTPPIGLLPWFNPLRVEVIPELAYRPHLNVLVPGLAMKHMSGGPNTAVNFAYRLAALGLRVRFVATDAPIEPDHSIFWEHARALTGIGEPLYNVELVDASDRAGPLQIGEHDVFMATAWWTAQIAKYAVRHTRHSRFIYLIQDYEPLLHPASTQSALCEETYRLDYIPIVNSSLLAEFLVSSKIGRFADADFARKTIAFEPAVDRTRFFPVAAARPGTKRRLLFYTRPMSGLRNLYEMGVAALQKVVAERILDPNEWEFVGMGEAFAPVPLGGGAVLQPAPWLNFDAYAQQVRESDVLLSLMLSPHPSYPPLEMAACGKPVVTTAYCNKTPERLSRISPHIIAVEATVEGIAEGLVTAIGRVGTGETDVDSVSALPATWDESFGEALPNLHRALVGLFDPPRLLQDEPAPWPQWFPGYRHWPRNYFDFIRLSQYRDRKGAYTDAAPGLISFMTPVWNTDPRFVEALAEAVLNQDCGPGYEWVLVDNAPTRADTVALLERLAGRPGVRLIRVETNLGIIGGLRCCLEAARNRYVVPLDADDLITPDCVRVLTSALRSSGYPALAYTDEDKAEENEYFEPYCKPDWDPVLFVHSCYISHLCAIDRELALSLGCYTDRRPEGSSDWDTFMRFFLAGHTPYHVPEVLYTWRMHPHSTAADIHSKDYIFSSQRHVLETFVKASAHPEAYSVELSPLFANTPDWRIVGCARPESAITTILVGGTNEEAAGHRKLPDHRAIGLSNQDDLAGLLRLVEAQDGRFVHLLSSDVVVENDSWANEAITLFDLFPDAVAVGGRVHKDGRIVAADGYFGFGDGWDSPNIGRRVEDSGYFVQMLKPHSASAVSSLHCVVRASFLGDTLRRLIGTVATFDNLGNWLGAAASTRGSRAIYSPFLLAEIKRELAPARPAECVAFRRAYAQLMPDTALLSPRLSLAPHMAYLPVSRAVRAAEEAALGRPLALSYAESHAADLLVRRLTTTPAAMQCRFALLTLLYARSPADLFRETARSALDQTLPFAEWIILENGPVSSEIGSALDELRGDPRIRLHRTEDLGIVGGLRYCLEHATAEYIVPLDGDDVLTVDALEHLGLGLLDERKPSFVFSDEDILAEGCLGSPFRRGAFDPVLNLADSYVWHACAFRRDRAIALQVYSDPLANYCHDWDSITRFAFAGETIQHVPHVLYHWRAHSGSSSNSGRTNLDSLASVRHVLERTIAQQRRPELYEVGPFPIFRGAEQMAILRRPLAPLPLGLVRIDAALQTDLPNEFRALAVQQTTLGDLDPLTVEYVAVLDSACTPIGDGGCWEAMRLWEMHPDVAVAGGRVLDSSGKVVESCSTLSGPAHDGLHRGDPGPFAMALKPQTATRVSGLFFFCRTDLLRGVIDRVGGKAEAAALSEQVACLARERGLRLAYSPLIEARKSK
jgi:glycosyltransferase involved in cell wall biosynthesis